MFTGIVEGMGSIRQATRKRNSIVFSIAAPGTMKGITANDSIAVNGVCLTVVKKKNNLFDVQAVEETLKKSSLGRLKSGDSVNLERALSANSRLDGHFVLGHVDCVGTISRVERRKSSRFYWVQVPRRFTPYLIPVGSVAIEGVSLTVASLSGTSFGVSIIPQTMRMTTFQQIASGDKVNIEFDVLGKYVVRMLSMRRK